MLEHPDVSSALRTGYATFQNDVNTDTPENRAEYIDYHMDELTAWLRAGHQEVLDEFIEFSGQACRTSYQDWLN